MNSSNIAMRFGETTDNFKGSKKSAPKKASWLTKQIVKNYLNMCAYVKQTGTTIEAVAQSVLENSRDTLEQYIRYKGEVPNQTISGIIAQAALLRMDDIATIASATDISEDDALNEMETAESEAVEINSPDKQNVLPPDVQAALNVVIDGLLTRMKQKGGISSVKDTMNAIKASGSATPLNNVKNPDNLAGEPYKGKPSGNVDADYAIGDIFGPAPTTVAAPIQVANPDDSSSSIWDILNQLANTATQVAGAIKSVSGSVNSTTQTVQGAINTAGGGVVSTGISQYVSKNWITILAALLAVAIIIILIVRATKSK